MKVVLIFLGIGLIYYLGFMYEYKTVLDRDSEAYNWYKENYLNKNIKGIVNTIINYGEGKKVIEIKMAKNEIIKYKSICTSDEFNHFVSKGDSIYKDSLSEFIYFKKSNGKLKSFKLDFCDF